MPPKRLPEPLLGVSMEEQAWNALGLSQAITPAALRQTHEFRHELERLAGEYVADV